MGNKQATTQPSVLSDDYSWSIVQKLDGYSVVRCDNTGALGQMYQVNIDQWNQEVAKYQFRKDNDQILVGIYSVSKNKGQFLCSTTETINVVTERMPYSLTDYDQLFYQEALYVLQQVVSGIKLLYEQNNMVTFDEKCVFVNQRGQVKVWVNEKLGLNLSQLQQQIRYHDLIVKIFTSIQNRTESNSIPEEYFKLKNQLKPENFSSALFFIKRVKFEHAAQTNNLPKPQNRKKKQTSIVNPSSAISKKTQQTDNVGFLLPNSKVNQKNLTQIESTQQSNQNNSALSDTNNIKKSQQTEKIEDKPKGTKKLPPLPPNRVKSIGKSSRSKEKTKLVGQKKQKQNLPQNYQQQPKVFHSPQNLIISPRQLNRDNSQRSLSKQRVQIVNSPRNIHIVHQPNFVTSMPIPYQPVHNEPHCCGNKPQIRTNQGAFKIVFNNSGNKSVEKTNLNGTQKSNEKSRQKIRQKSIQKINEAQTIAQKIAFNQQSTVNRAPKINFTFGSQQ